MHIGFKGTIHFHKDIGMPINALSDAHKHLIKALVAVKIIVVRSDYTWHQSSQLRKLIYLKHVFHKVHNSQGFVPTFSNLRENIWFEEPDIA